MNLSDLEGKATISIPEAGEILGLKRSHAYASAALGQIPTLSFGNRKRVPVSALLRLLGNEEGPSQKEGPSPTPTPIPSVSVPTEAERKPHVTGSVA